MYVDQQDRQITHLAYRRCSIVPSSVFHTLYIVCIYYKYTILAEVLSSFCLLYIFGHSLCCALVTETSNWSTSDRSNLPETELARERIFLVHLREACRQGNKRPASDESCLRYAVVADIC